MRQRPMIGTGCWRVTGKPEVNWRNQAITLLDRVPIPPPGLRLRGAGRGRRGLTAAVCERSIFSELANRNAKRGMASRLFTPLDGPSFNGY
jgi:hypothetical protein